MNETNTKKGFMQVWKELNFFLIWFAVIGWLIASFREDKPWQTLGFVLVSLGILEAIYLTGYWVFVGFKPKT